jgi:hypothetical protein
MIRFPQDKLVWGIFGLCSTPFCSLDPVALVSKKKADSVANASFGSLKCFLDLHSLMENTSICIEEEKVEKPVQASIKQPPLAVEVVTEPTKSVSKIPGCIKEL